MERKRIFIVGIVAVLLLPSMLVLSESASANSFTLHSWEVVDKLNSPCLFITFDIELDWFEPGVGILGGLCAKIKMFNPNDEQVRGFGFIGEYTIVNESMHSAYIPLAPACNDSIYYDGVTPTGGTYRMEVETYPINPSVEPETIFTKYFYFTGPQLSVIECNDEWKYYGDSYHLTDLNITVENNGDLPAYCNTLSTTINNKTDWGPRYATFLPNEKTNISCLCNPTFVLETFPPGNYEMTITVKDSSNKNVLTYTKQVSLEKKGGSTPGFELAFAIVALLVVAYYLRKRR